MPRRRVVPKKNEAAINELLTSMKGAKKFARMCEYSVTCMCKMAVDDTSAEEIINCGAIETMVELVKANPGNPKFQAMLNKLVSTLSRNDELAAMIAERMGGNFKPIIDSLNQAETAEDAIKAANAIAGLCKHDGNLAGLRDQGAVEALVNASKRFPGNIELMTATNLALARLGDPNNQVVKSGYAENLVKAMNGHLDDHALTASGVALMRHSPDPEGFKRLGAVDTIVNAVECFPFDTQLLADARVALARMTGEDDLISNIAMIQGNAAVDEATAKALATVSSLCLVEDNVGFFFANGGVEAAMSALHHALKDEDDPETAELMTQSGCALIQRCATAGDEAQRYALLQNGAVAALIEAINKNLQNEAICQAAIQGLAALSTRKENADFIIESGGIEAVIAAVAAQPTSKPIARSAIEFFNALGEFEETADKVTAHKGIETLTGILKNHGSNAELCEKALLSFGKFATSAENVAEMARCGLLPLVKKAIAEHKENEAVQRAAMMLAETLSLVPANAEELKRINTIPAICSVSDFHHANPELRQLCAAAIEGIEGHERMLELQRLEAERLAAAEAAEAARLAELERLRQQELLRQRAELERLRAEAEAREALRMAELQKAADLLEVERQENIKAVQLRKAELKRAKELEAHEVQMQEAMEAAQIAARKSENELLVERLKMEREAKKRARAEEYERKKAEMRARKEAVKNAKDLEEARLMELKRMEMERLDALQRQKDADAKLRSMQSAQALEEQQRREREEDARRREEQKERYRLELERQAREARERKEAERTHVMAMNTGAHLLGKMGHSGPLGLSSVEKRAKDIFQDEPAPKQEINFDPDIKEFLKTGALLVKHSKSAAPRNRHIYLSPDEKSICWKNPRKPLQDSQMMKITKIRGVDAGRATPQLQRKKGGKFLVENEKCCFSVWGSAKQKKATKEEERYRRDADVRTIDLEAPTPNEAKKWVAAFQHVIDYCELQRLFGGDNIKLVGNALAMRDHGN